MRFRRVTRWWLCALLLIPALSRAADVRATLDRTNVQLGETVTLNLHVSGDAGNVDIPDLSPLGADFDILGTSQSDNVSVVNGAATAERTIGLALRPKHVGVLQIPALSLAGSQTAPLQLQVSAADPATAVDAHKDIFMEAQVEPEHGYIGQQLSYVVRLFFVASISSGSLDLPQVPGAEMSPVGDDLNYDAVRDGRNYHVLERRYALVPQHAGQLAIPAANFQGEALDPNDPNSFFGTSARVSASAPALTVEVQAVPADWGKPAWLPARQLSLSLDGWPAAQEQLRVGQPLNLTMTLQATGLSYEALPALSMPALDGATVYPDKPVTGNRHDDQWIVGRRQQAFAIVPERAGSLTIPAITVKWWNVLTQHAEVAQIAAHQITVLPATGVATGPAAAVTAGATPATAAASVAHVTPWRWIALGSVGLWLFSVLAWWLWRGGRRATPVIAAAAERMSARQYQQAFIAAARGNDAAAQAHSLLAWARAERPVIQHLGELSQALDDDRQRAAIAALQQRQYAGRPRSDEGTALVEVFKRGFDWRVVDAGDGDGDLPPLYPFKLH